jgi:hypothetical protein
MAHCRPTVTELSTPGERLARRPLQIEKRLGVEHYKPGQMRARQCDEDKDVYEVCALLFVRDADEETGWMAFPIFARVGYGGFATQERLPQNFAPTAGMIDALDAVHRVASGDSGTAGVV